MAGPTTRLHASPRERWLVLGGLGLALGLALVLGLALAPAETRLLLGLMAAAFFALGKFLPLVAIEEPTFGFYELGLVIWAMDTVTVLLMVYGLEAVLRWRRAARFFERVEARAALVLEVFPRIRRYAMIGLVVFVLFPVSGTGAIVGTLLGVLLGLDRKRILFAVSLGGLIGGLGMAALAERFGRVIEGYKDEPWIVVILVVLLVGAIVALELAYRRALKRREALRSEPR
ncbi:MAG: small multi-drug export protein [Deltaproteobacteria bacterium]|nr:small multi-drug export protein [Deltaproteobacteria bacterium]